MTILSKKSFIVAVTPRISRRPRSVDLQFEKLDTYVLDLASTFLGFARDVELSALVLVEDLERLCIQTEAVHGRMGQDE